MYTQIYGHCQPSDADSLAQEVYLCIDEVSAWIKVNRLQLNPTKTDVLWCVSSRRQHLIPAESVRASDVGDVSVSPVTAVRNLGVHIDADVSMRNLKFIKVAQKITKYLHMRSGGCVGSIGLLAEFGLGQLFGGIRTVLISYNTQRCAISP